MEIWMISLLFGLIVFLIIYLVLKVFVEMRSSLEKRMKAIEELGDTSGTHQKEKKEKVQRRPLFRAGARLTASVEDAGVTMSPDNFLFLWALCVTVPGLVGFLILQSPIFGLLFAAVGGFLPMVYLKFKRSRRVSQFSTQLGDALMVISNCLRSGLSFKQAMQRVIEDMPDPLRGEFQKGIVKLNYGAPLDDVLKEIAANMDNRDMNLLTAAIGLNQRVGGSLAEIVDTVVGTIRERIQIRQQLKALTAMGRMSGWIIGLLPVIMLAYFMFSNPDYMGWFFRTLVGNIVLGAAAVWEIIGILIIRKIVNIKL